TASLSASTSQGNIYIAEIAGDLKIDQVIAHTGDVTITSLGSIEVASGREGLVQGGRINLSAETHIGAAENHLLLESGSSLRDHVTVFAKSDVHLMEQSGDLRLKKVESTTGDV